MATLNDTALGSNSASGTSLSTADALAVTAGDLVKVEVKWEGANGAVATVDTGASTPLFTTANSVVDHSSVGLHAQTFYWKATATGTVTPRFLLDSARDFRAIRAYSVTPANGTELVLDAVVAAQGNSDVPSSGAATASGAGFSSVHFGLFGSRALTPGAGWSEAAEFNITAAVVSEYQLQTSGGSQTGNGTLDFNVEFIAQQAIFKEQAVGGGGGSIGLEDPVWLALEQQTNPIIVTVF
jgi:hypothetical protein